MCFNVEAAKDIQRKTEIFRSKARLSDPMIYSGPMKRSDKLLPPKIPDKGGKVSYAIPIKSSSLQRASAYEMFSSQRRTSAYDSPSSQRRASAYDAPRISYRNSEFDLLKISSSEANVNSRVGQQRLSDYDSPKVTRNSSNSDYDEPIVSKKTGVAKVSSQGTEYDEPKVPKKHTNVPVITVENSDYDAPKVSKKTADYTVPPALPRKESQRYDRPPKISSTGKVNDALYAEPGVHIGILDQPPVLPLKRSEVRYDVPPKIPNVTSDMYSKPNMSKKRDRHSKLTGLDSDYDKLPDVKSEKSSEKPPKAPGKRIEDTNISGEKKKPKRCKRRRFRKRSVPKLSEDELRVIASKHVHRTESGKKSVKASFRKKPVLPVDVEGMVKNKGELGRIIESSAVKRVSHVETVQLSDSCHDAEVCAIGTGTARRKHFKKHRPKKDLSKIKDLRVRAAIARLQSQLKDKSDISEILTSIQNSILKKQASLDNKNTENIGAEFGSLEGELGKKTMAFLAAMETSKWNMASYVQASEPLLTYHLLI